MSVAELSPSTGLPGLDQILHGVRAGDNIVWKSDHPEDYLPFVSAFCRHAKETGRKMVYFRFAGHVELVDESSGVRVVRLDPHEGFEPFITEIHRVIKETGKGACYVFDSLSELAVDCFSERMTGNFFALTCPYLFRLETVAYFHLLRNYNSHHAAKPIADTTQLLLDVHCREGRIYVHPLKVEGRYSPTMHMLHEWKDDTFVPIEASPITSGVLNAGKWYGLQSASYRMVGVWDRRFIRAEETQAAYLRGECSEDEVDAVFQHQLTQLISRDERILRLAREYLHLDDLVYAWKRTIGSGLIGGKAVGMLLARAILSKKRPEWNQLLEEHDSFYVGSDLFYTFLVQNDCWSIRQKQKDPETLFEELGEARERIMRGSFPDYVVRRFSDMLDYFGQSPIIVRSSSLLEDNYGNAFAGKYESVFCVNRGTREERLDAFLNAVRTIYASTMSEEALAYRADRGVLDQDEQMALLVMRVSGATHGKRYFPQVAGVGMSFNPYVWSKEIDPQAGVLRLVFGLGTRAVNQAGDDYTRVVSLSAPDRRPEASFDEVCQYAQRHVDYLDLEENQEATGEFTDLCRELEGLAMDLLSSTDRTRGARGSEPYRVLTFDRFLRDTAFVDQMSDMLKVLEDAYDHPVDTEFTVNFMPDSSHRINLLQCRPLQVKGTATVDLPEVTVASEQRVIEARGAVVGHSRFVEVDRVIYVVPELYGRLPQQERYAVARLVGEINREAGQSGCESVMAIGPGRWGTTTASLGVPVSSVDINRVSILCEVAGMHENLIPDISLGTHFFNELVERNMLYLAVLPEQGDNFLDRAFFEQSPNRLLELIPSAEKLQEVVRVIEPSTNGIRLLADAVNQKFLCYRDEAASDRAE